MPISKKQFWMTQPSNNMDNIVYGKNAILAMLERYPDAAFTAHEIAMYINALETGTIQMLGELYDEGKVHRKHFERMYYYLHKEE